MVLQDRVSRWLKPYIAHLSSFKGQLEGRRGAQISTVAQDLDKAIYIHTNCSYGVSISVSCVVDAIKVRRTIDGDLRLILVLVIN